MYPVQGQRLTDVLTDNRISALTSTVPLPPQGPEGGSLCAQSPKKMGMEGTGFYSTSFVTEVIVCRETYG